MIPLILLLCYGTLVEGIAEGNNATVKLPPVTSTAQDTVSSPQKKKQLLDNTAPQNNATNNTLTVSNGDKVTTKDSTGLTTEAAMTSSSYTLNRLENCGEEWTSHTKMMTYTEFYVSHYNIHSFPHNNTEFAIKCVLRDDVAPSCKLLLDGLVVKTQLYHYNNSEYTLLNVKSQTILKNDSDCHGEICKKFVLLLDHDIHDGVSIICKADLPEKNISIESVSYELNVKDAYHVSMTPVQVEQLVRSNFTLTCNAEEVIDKPLDEVKFEWKRQKGNEDSVKTELWDRSTKDISIKKYINMSTGRYYSKLIASHETEWTGEYSCSIAAIPDNRPRATSHVTIKFKNNSILIAGITLLFVALVLLVIVSAVIFLRKRALKKKINTNLLRMQLQAAPVVTTDEPASNLYIGDGETAAFIPQYDSLEDFLDRMTQKYALWQRDRNQLKLKHVLGEGNFGSVILGNMPDVHINGLLSNVAVKTIKGFSVNSESLVEFEKEINVMTTLQHENIVNLMGLCTETLPLYIIMEFMVNGQLNEFLMKHKPNKVDEVMMYKLETKDLLYMSVQPCKAIEYLASKNIVHRDISARNCLVGEDLIVKLADFGLSRGTKADTGKDYYKKDGGMVPVKWMSPEALTFGKYTTANDVWAFGILMWEIFSFGAVPYSWLPNQEVICYVNRGERLTKPEMCNLNIWELVTMCWADSPDNRISIGALSSQLQNELKIMSEFD